MLTPCHKRAPASFSLKDTALAQPTGSLYCGSGGATLQHPQTAMRDLKKQYGWYRPRQRMLRWHDNGVVPMPLATLRVVHYQQGADPGPTYA